MDAAGCDAGSFGIPALLRAGKHQRARTGARSAAVGGGNIRHATETKTKADQLPDGRSIPSLDRSSRQTPSYVGLSLSVPTSDKTLNFPVPLALPW